jgi:hypothetical protein
MHYIVQSSICFSIFAFAVDGSLLLGYGGGVRWGWGVGEEVVSCILHRAHSWNVDNVIGGFYPM